jgi:hypothetical protein
MSKHEFNHDLESIPEACGLNTDILQERLDKVVSDKGTRSTNIEAMSNEFTTVELAFMLDGMFEIVAKQEQHLQMVATLMELREEGSDED